MSEKVTYVAATFHLTNPILLTVICLHKSWTLRPLFLNPLNCPADSPEKTRGTLS